MEKNAINNIRLGVFIIAGLIILVVSLYIIGQNQNFFGSNFSLKARFHNVNGLMPGNNVRFSGIQCGTVKDIEIINDSTIEVLMLIREKTSSYIRSNARASIGTEGLMGNKIINIFPGTADAPPISDGGMLSTVAEKGIDDIVGSLSATGDNAVTISSSLKLTAEQINGSPVLEQLLTDTTMTENLHQSLANFKQASLEIGQAAMAINLMMSEVQKGGGAAGVLLTDRQSAAHLTHTIERIRNASERADTLVANIQELANDIHYDLNQGKGAAHLLLKDSSITQRLQNSMENIEKGTAAFNEDMQALKHNFLLRRYFRRQERAKAK